MRDCPFERLAGIAAIGIQSGERGIRVAGSLDQAKRPVAVLNISAVHHAFEHVAECVGHDVALAPLYLLASVVSARPTRLGGLD